MNATSQPLGQNAMSDEDPLVAELRKPEYAAMSDQQAADAINAKTFAYRRKASSADVKACAIRAGYWADIDEGCDSTDAGTRRLCRNIRGWLEDCAGKLPEMDMDAAATTTMLAALETKGLITAANRAELLALGDASCPWWQHVGIGQVGIGAVRNARKQIAAEAGNAQ
jgi:hypothetical protein